MRFNYQKLATLAVSLTLSLLLCASQESSALPQSSNPISRGIGGLVGAASGAIAGGVAGASAGANATGSSSEGSSSLGASASASQSNGSGSSGGNASLSASANLSGSSSSGSGSPSLSGGSSGGISASGSASLETGSSSSGGSSSSLSSQTSISIGSSTPKPEGLVDKVKDLFKGGKEIIKDSVSSLTRDDKKDVSKVSAEASASGSGGGSSQASAGASLNLSGSGGSSSSGASSNGSSGSSSGSSGSSSSLSASANLQSSGSQSSGTASASLTIGTSTPKPIGLLDKMSKIAEKGKEALKEVIGDPKKDNKSNNGSGAINASASGSISGGSAGGSSGSASAGSSISGGGGGGGSGSGIGLRVNASANINIGNNDGMKKFDERRDEKKEGTMDKVQKLVSKGTETLKETAHSIENKATLVTDKISKALDDNIRKPMQSVSGSGTLTQEGQLSASAQATAQMKGADRDRHLIEVKKEQEGKLARPSSLKEVVTEAKTKGIIPQSEDRSVLRGNHADEKSVAVEVFDKAHEISKIPVESVLKPIDKMLGYEKDPLMRLYDNSHEILRRPLTLFSKPVESVLTGAFKTSDEAKKESEKLLATTSEQERKEARLKEERARKEDRSVVGSIADKTVELATKPMEIVLKPFDHVFGLDKDGRKNPILRALDEIYGLSKKPVDAFAKPFESILKKMADGDQLYQVSLRFNDETSDPKLVTRLADGALNVADRVLTKPLEIVMKPLNHALGYDEPGKKNPIMEAAHQLKNATKVGVELFTRPIDRIIKEIADIGENKSEAQRDADYERQKQDASRLVQALDKLHEVIQYPFEIVLRPMGKALGTTKGGKKDPLLRAWDVIHQVVRTPIQVISKPFEEALLGDRSRKSLKGGINIQASASANGGQQQGGQAGAKASIGANIGPIKAGASISLGKNGGSGGGANVNVQSDAPHKKNIFIDGIKTVEKFATKPLDVITSPIRKMILGEDNEKVGSETDKNNREIQAKAQVGNGKVSAQLKTGSNQGGKRPDKIMKALEKMNNVILRPLEEITQPISDIISPEKKVEVKAQVSTQARQQPQPHSQPQPQPQPQQQQQQQQQPKQISASAQAQIKKN